MKNKKGLFVCFEGIDGSGKTTQAKLLKKALESSGIKCVMFGYPDYDSPYGKMIDRYLNKKIEMSPSDLLLVFIADMVKDARSIRSSIKAGKVVITDRYFYSTIAYQSAAGFSYRKAKELEDSVSLPLPSCLFYLDMPVNLARERKIKQKWKADRNESDTDYMKQVKKYYERLLAERYTGVKFIRIDGTSSAKKNHESIIRYLKSSHAYLFS